MGYKAGNYDNNQAVDPASCPNVDGAAQAAALVLMGYEIAAMTGRRVAGNYHGIRRILADGPTGVRGVRAARREERMRKHGY